MNLRDEAKTAADDLLEKVFRLPLARVEKARAKPDPLTPKGFDAVVLGLLKEMKSVANPIERQAIADFLQKLERQWAGLTPEERSKAIREAADAYLGVSENIGPTIGKVLQGQGPLIAADVKKAAAKRHGLSIGFSLDAANEAVLAHAAYSQSLYITDQFGKRSDVLAAKARDIVAMGLEEGLDRFDIAKRLKEEIGDLNQGRSNAYYQMIASVFAARARTYAELSSFEEAGITTFQFEAVLDEVTTDVCRMMHGRTFSVRSALSRYEAVADAGNPEAVKDLQPWVSNGKAPDGSQGLFYKSGGKRVQIARVDSTGVGAKDNIGIYSDVADRRALEGAGIMSPPLHGHCRSTIIPGPTVVESAPREAPAPVQAPAPAILQPEPVTPAGPFTPAPLPANIADLVRPLPNAADRETLPAYVPAPPAPPKPALTPAQQKVRAALEAVSKLPVEPNSGGMALVHGHPSAPKDADGFPIYPYESNKVTGHKIGGAKKSKTQTIPLSNIVVLSDVLHKPTIESRIKSLYGGPDKPPPMLLVKSGGKYYPHPVTAYNDVLAASLAGESSIEAKVVDLDKVAKPKKPKANPLVANANPAPPAMTVAPTVPAPVVNLSAATQTGDAAIIMGTKLAGPSGSNDGGLFEGKDGKKRYVKFYTDPAQAYSEHLSNKLYADLGMTSPNSQVFMHNGKLAYASEIIEGGETLAKLGLTKARADKFLDGFVGDVLTGNWDAVGMTKDNAFFTKSGDVVRIDNGGTFLMRAKNGRKPPGLLNDITEWKEFFTTTNPSYSEVAGAAGVTSPDDMRDRVAAQIRKALAVRDKAGGWRSYVTTHAPGLNASDRDSIIEMLDERSKLLEKKLEEFRKPKPPSPAPGAARYIGPQYSTVQPRAGLTIKDLPETTVIDDNYRKYQRYGDNTKMPSGERLGDYRKRAAAAIKNIPTDALNGIKSFTGSGYDDIRADEERGRPDSRSNAIQKAYAVATPEPGTVYRGIRYLDKSVVERFLNGDPVFRLGKKDTPATSSTAWNIDASIDGFMSGLGDHSSPDQYKILYVINGKTQIPVQTISTSGEGETELLMRRDATFRITGLSRALGTQRVLIVEAEEIVP